MTNMLVTAEAALRKRLDLSSAHITRTDKVLVIQVANKRRRRPSERCLTLLRDSSWDITGYPTRNEQARLFGKPRTLSRGDFFARDLPRVVEALGEAQTGEKAK